MYIRTYMVFVSRQPRVVSTHKWLGSDVKALNYISCPFLFPGRPEPVPLRDCFRRSIHGEDRGLRQYLRPTELGENKVRDRM